LLEKKSNPIMIFVEKPSVCGPFSLQAIRTFGRLLELPAGLGQLPLVICSDRIGGSIFGPPLLGGRFLPQLVQASKECL